MNTEAQIQQAYAEAKNYPDLASKLIAIGITSYTVDTATGTILYRFAAGEFVLHDGEALRKINPVFNQEATIQTIRDSQQRKIDYAGFMDAIAEAGVRFYEATLAGPNPRVTYIGTGGFYEEKSRFDKLKPLFAFKPPKNKCGNQNHRYQNRRVAPF